MTHIFISYAREETKSLAIPLADKLNTIEGLTVWVDRDIEDGDDWETLIQRQIFKCDYLIVLYSPSINRHIYDELKPKSYVVREIRYAQLHKKTIIPVMIQQTEPPISLIGIQHIEYEKEGMSLDDLVDRLRKRMKIVPPPETDINNISSTTLRRIMIPPKPKIVLDAPFDWCYIPAGDVTLNPDGHDKDVYIRQETQVNVPTVWMSKYPITNKQYRQFVMDGGYVNDDWWTVSGIAWRGNNRKPYHLDDPKWNADDCPVVGVCWYEAVAFCRWMTAQTGENIMLPTDAMWQRAASGDEGRVYPWGNFWRDDVCNHNISKGGVGNTTPVRQYEDKGSSPFGVVDMAGNVWEWCLTTYQTGRNDLEGTDIRILRGGAWWNEDISQFTTTFRIKYVPSNSWGFRVVCGNL